MQVSFKGNSIAWNEEIYEDAMFRYVMAIGWHTEMQFYNVDPGATYIFSLFVPYKVNVD